jgi:nucleoside-diphosphate-sugar epimerase
MRVIGVIYLKVLVTGSTGQLGSALLKQLKNTDYQVKITSRRKPEDVNYEWVYSDLMTGEGLEEALDRSGELKFHKLSYKLRIVT